MPRRCKSLNYRSLFLFSGQSRFRQWVLALTEHKAFEIFIFAAIVINCAVISIQSSFAKEETAYDVLLVLDLAFNCIFVLELVLRVIAHGFVFHRHSYLRNPWNVLDFIVVLLGFPASLASFLGTTTLNLKSLRLFRVLRPLRLIAVSRDLRVVLDTIISSLGPLTHVATFILLLISLWATIGLELFSGLFHPSCFNVTSEEYPSPDTDCNLVSCPNGTTCRNAWDEAGNVAFSFDNIGVSLLTVFRVFTLDSWSLVLYKINEASDSSWAWLYFVTFILIGSYFSTDLLLGILGNEYLKTKAQTARERPKNNDVLPSSIRQKMNAVLKRMRKKLRRLEMRSNRLRPFRSACKRLVRSRTFFYVVMAVIFMNTLCLGLEHNNQPLALTIFLEIINVVFVVCFGFELLFKFMAYGTSGYFASKFRTFDFALVVLGIVEVFTSYALNWQSVGLNVMRCLRLIRIFRLTKFWPNMSAMIDSFVHSLRAICSLIAVLLITMFVYALLGHQLFASGDEEDTLVSFDSLGRSLLKIFVILTEGGWPQMLEPWARSYCPQSPSQCIIVPILFLTSLVVFGGFILMNIFLGIVVDNMTDGLSNGSAQSVFLLTMEASKADRPGPAMPKIAIDDIGDMSLDNRLPRSFYEIAKDDHNMIDTESMQPATNVRFECLDYGLGPAASSMPSVTRTQQRRSTVAQLKRLSEFTQPRLRQMSVWLDPNVMRTVPHHNALGLFSPYNRFRQLCFDLVSSSWFPGLCMTAIVLSTLVLAFESPLEDHSTKARVLKYIDYGFTGLFTIEIILKSIALGLVYGHPRCFLRDPMNIVDAGVVLLSLINIALEATGSDSQVHLGMLRFLRVFRALKVFPSVKQVIDCLLASIQNMISFLFFYALVMYIYAVIGVKLYSGKLVTCEDQNGLALTDCLSINGTNPASQIITEQARFNFNNILEALISLFVVSTLDDWSDLLEGLGSAVGSVTSRRIIVVIYLVSFIVITSFLMLNVVVGFVIVAFHKEKKDLGDYQVLSKHAQDCIETAVNIKQRKHNDALPWWRKKIWYLVTSTSFEYVSLSCIVANVIIITTKHYGQETMFSDVQEISNLAFITLFTIELILKLIAFGPKSFLRDEWCVFDTAVVVGSWVDVALTSWDYDVNLSFSALRVFRSVRIVKLVSKEGNLRQLLRTFIKSMRSIPSVALLLCLLFYIYAVIGMQLFGRLSTQLPSSAITEHANFQSFPVALLTLLRVTTLDGWKYLMMSCSDTRSANCLDSMTENCGTKLSYAYFITFVFASSFLVTNLFLAVVMENFEYLTHDCSVLDVRHIVNLADTWNQIDTARTGRVHTSQFAGLLRRVSPPLGSGHMCPRRTMYRKLLSLRLVIDENNTIDFQEFLLALVIKALNLTCDSRSLRNDILVLHPTIDEAMLERLVPATTRPSSLSTMQQSFHTMCAAIVLQDNVREFLRRCKQRATDRRLSESDLVDVVLKSTSSLPQVNLNDQSSNNPIRRIRSLTNRSHSSDTTIDTDIDDQGSSREDHAKRSKTRGTSLRRQIPVERRRYDPARMSTMEAASRARYDWITDDASRMSNAQPTITDARRYSNTIKLRRQNIEDPTETPPPVADENNNNNK